MRAKAGLVRTSLRLSSVPFLVLLCVSFGYSQDGGALLPWITPQFTNGAVPLANGFVCAYAGGTTTPQDTFQDPGLMTANQNPIRLSSAGQPINGAALVPIYLQPLVYKFVLYGPTPPMTNTCNGTRVGALIRTIDNVYDFAQLRGLGGVLLASDFPGSDCGAQINAAYAALPSGGGEIWVQNSCTFITPISFSSSNKVAILKGYGNATTLTYNGSGTALTLNNGILFDFATTVRDLTLTGPGNSTSTTGVVIGGSNGCVGCALEHVKIQSFGTGIQTSSHTWLTRVSQSMIRDNGTNLMMPSGQTEAGENVLFDHDVFADAPTPHTNSVWVQGGGQEVVFESCSFDQAQVRIGNGNTSSAQVVIHDGHFENPNFGLVGAVDYVYLTVDHNNGNFLRLTDSYMLQDRTSGSHYSKFMELDGGVAVITGLGMFTPGGVPLDSVANLANAVNIDLFAFNDLSGNAVALFSGSTSGYVSSFPGADTGTSSGFNNVLKAGDAIGGAALDVAGNVRSNLSLVSTRSTGTAPLTVNSTTPVNNLFANVVVYNHSGTQAPSNTHVVQDSAALSTGAVTITLTGSAVFTNSSSYSCQASDTTATNATSITYSSGSSFAIHGTGSDNVSYSCVGY